MRARLDYIRYQLARPTALGPAFIVAPARQRSILDLAPPFRREIARAVGGGGFCATDYAAYHGLAAATQAAASGTGNPV